MHVAACRYVPTGSQDATRRADRHPAAAPVSSVCLGRSLPDHDEELILLQERVIWSAGLKLTRAETTEPSDADESPSSAWGTRVIKSLHFPSSPGAHADLSDPALAGINSVEAIIRGGSGVGGPILAAVWATFANFRTTTADPQLCVLQPHCLHILNSEGDQATVRLPCKAKAIWVLLEGILIERDATGEVQPVSLDPLSSCEDITPPPPAPVFFSLRHPLEELKPVSSVDPALDQDEYEDDEEEDRPMCEWMCDTNEQIVYSCATQPFVLTYHTVRKVHSLWLIRQSRREVWNRLKLDGNSGPNAVVVDEDDAPAPSSSASAAVSRRASAAWQPQPHQLTPTHPSHTHATERSSGDAKDFYRQFLLSTLTDQASAQPAYHAATAPHAHDDDDSVIHTELLFERSWVQTERVEFPCTNAFLSCDAENEPLLCLFTEQSHRFQAFRLTSSLHPQSAAAIDEPHVPRVHLTPLFEHHFLSAVPIYASWHVPLHANLNPYNYAVLALEQDGGVAVYVGDTKLADVDIEFGTTRLTPTQPPMSITTHRGGASRVAFTPARGGVVDVHDASFASGVSFTPLDPSSRHAALFRDTPRFATGADIDLQASSAQATHARPAIVRLRDAVSNRVTLEMQDGQLFRVALPTHYLSTLVRTCMNSLACSLSAQLILTLRSDLLRMRTELWRQRRDGAHSMHATRTPSPMPTEHDEWQAFVTLIRRLLGCTSNTKSTTTVESSDSSSAWQRLLASRYHRAQLRRPGLAPLAASAESSPASVDDDRVDLDHLTLSTSRDVFLSELPHAFLCLHLLYEELKLPVLHSLRASRTSAPAPPAVLLACEVLQVMAIAHGQYAYLDAYSRELSSQPTWRISSRDLELWAACPPPHEPNAGPPIVPAQPPSIHAFLMSRLSESESVISGGAGGGVSSRVYPLPVVPGSVAPGRAHTFLLNTSMDEPFAWSRKLLLFYDLLTRRDHADLVPMRAADASDHVPTASQLLPSPSRVQVSEFIHSPYALPAIEQKQIEAQRAAIAARHWSGSVSSSAAATPAGLLQPPSFTPHQSPTMRPVNTTATHALMLSPLLTSPFPTPLSPFGLKQSASAARVQQQKRVQSMQMQAATAAAKAAGFAPPPQSGQDEHIVHDDSPLQTPQPRAVNRKKARVSFGANTTVGTVGTVGTMTSTASRRAAVAADFPVFSPSTLAHAVPLFLSHSSAESVVLAMVAEEFTLEHLSMLPVGVALPLLECLKQVREQPPVSLHANATPTHGAVAVAAWPREAYLLIGREDLGRMFSSLSAATAAAATDADGKDAAGSSLHSSSDPDRCLEEEMDVAAGRPADISLDRKVPDRESRLPEQADLDGTLLVQRESALRFGVDLRLKEVRHLLRTDRVLCVSLDAAVRTEIDAGTAEASVENQIRLGIVAKRALSLPIARGMYTLASIVPVLTESLPIPPFVLRGRLPPMNSIVELDFSPGNPANVSPATLHWPDFHNGVAAALRVQPAKRPTTTDIGNALDGTSSITDSDEPPKSSNPHAGDNLPQITRTWIVYNRPTMQAAAAAGSNGATSNANAGGLSYAHAGFLFGLGLTGHLSCLTASDFFWYLSQNHEATAVAMLLGMAACRRGSLDTVVSKMLTLHIPALLPANFSEMNIPSVVQSCALLGLGLLYQRSCHRLMAELLISEIGRRPDRFKSDESFLLERENYALSAGFGLGLLLLGRGADANAMSGLADLNVEKQLSLYIHGGKDAEAAAAASADAGAGMTGGVAWMTDLTSRRPPPSNTAAGIGTAAARSTANHAAAAASAKNGRIKEGSLVNVDVTSPGATLALGLMYLQSNNRLMAGRLVIPATHFMLDYVRADFLFLRVLARHLIMWDEIPNTTSAACTAAMTDLLTTHCLGIRYYMEQRKTPMTTDAKKSSRKHDDSKMQDSDAEEEDDTDDASVAEEEQVTDDDDPFSSDDFSGPPVLPAAACGAEADIDIDYATLRQSYLYVLSANCFAMGLKYAGTADARALRVLTRIMDALRLVAKKRGGGDFIQLTMQDGLNPAAQLHKVDRGTIDSSLVAVATAISLVMCGSGNLTVFKMLRRLLKTRPEKTTPAGWYASISMCIGLIFLGGGRCTIDTSQVNAAGQANIAYLVIALYPHLAHAVDEQRYYLQIYRHLYVLATSQRGLQTIDVDTGLPCYVPMEVIVQQGQEKARQTQSKIVTKRLRFITPCLLPAYDTIERISIVSPRFHALTLHLRPHGGSPVGASQTTLAHHLQRIYVKKKIGYESYEKDPKGLRSIMSRTFPQSHRLVAAALGRDEEDQTKAHVEGRRSDFLKSFSNDERLLSFTRLFIRDADGDASGDHAPASAALIEYLSGVLYECLQEEKFFQMIQIYLQLFPIAHDQPECATRGEEASESHQSRYHRTLEAQLSDVGLIWSILLLKQYYHSARQVARANHDSDNALVHSRPPVNASVAFHSLPLAEGSAGVDIADDDSFVVGATSTSRPLLARAFLDAILMRVDTFFAEHRPLQRAFTTYVQQAAKNDEHAVQATDQANAHPLMGSLLRFWSVPSLADLRGGLAMMRQMSTSSPPSASRSSSIVMAGLLWPHMHTAAVHAVLAASQT